MRGYSQGDAILLLAAGIAMAGLCRPLGLQECALAGLALAAVAVMKAGHGCLRLPRRQMWHVWGASALLCAAIAAGEQGPAALPASPGLALGVPLLTGAIYGASAGALSRMLSGTNARALPAAVPFLSVAAECAIGGSAHLPQVAAAAILLAAAAAGSRRLPAPPCSRRFHRRMAGPWAGCSPGLFPSPQAPAVLRGCEGHRPEAAPSR